MKRFAATLYLILALVALSVAAMAGFPWPGK